MTTYKHTSGGSVALTIATLDDGRMVIVDRYDGTVVECQSTANLDGVDIAYVLADAIANGKFGPAPAAEESQIDKQAREDGMRKVEDSRNVMARVMRD